MPDQIHLSPVEGIEVIRHHATLDGFAAGVKAAVETAKQLYLEDVMRRIQSKQAAPPPVPEA
jgi:RecJ-like exonuclease